jgi:glycosyltransferase involved in cell wall biosynthesis
MRIVVAHDAIDTDGGVETYLLAVLTELRRRGHQVALAFCQGGKGTSLLPSSAHTTFDIGANGIDAALAAIAGWQPDVCYSHNMGPLDVDRALLGRFPVVKMLHGFFGTCISGLKMHAWPAAVACQRAFGPACLALYVPRRCGQLTPSALVRGYAWASDQRSLFSRYASIVVASRYMGEELKRNGVAGGRVNVVPLFSTVASAAAAVDGEPDTLLFAGRMTQLKGGHVLIAAAARAARTLERPVRLIMAGDGPQREEWRRLAASLRVPAEMTGWVSFADRPSVYARGVAIVVPSLWPEPFGLVGLDAAALGRPAIAFDVGGIGEWLTDGANGRLVDAGSGEQGLADAIVALLATPAERGRMAVSALATASRMTVAAHVESLERVLLGAAA